SPRCWTNAKPTPAICAGSDRWERLLRWLTGSRRDHRESLGAAGLVRRRLRARGSGGGRPTGDHRAEDRGAGHIRAAAAVGMSTAGDPAAGPLTPPAGLLPDDAAMPRCANHGVGRSD